MKTTAIITGQPRVIKTAGGERSIVYAQVAGDRYAIYRAAGDPEIMGLKEGQEVEVAILCETAKPIGEKGAELLPSQPMGFVAKPAARPPVKPQQPEISPTVDEIPSRPMGFSVTAPFEAEKKLRQKMAAAQPPSRSAEIADYIGRLGKLYAHCYTTASTQLEDTGLAKPEVKDVATTLFIQTVRHFGI